MNDTIETRVIRFISNFCRVPINNIDGSSTLQMDLGVDGDDAVELIREYSRYFNVDISKFDFDLHFWPERPIGIASLLYLLIRFFMLGKERGEKYELRVSHLVAGVKNGNLDSSAFGIQP